jgi:hypothetical protein
MTLADRNLTASGSQSSEEEDQNDQEEFQYHPDLREKQNQQEWGEEQNQQDRGKEQDSPEVSPSNHLFALFAICTLQQYDDNLTREGFVCQQGMMRYFI